MTTGERIKGARTRKGLTQQELAGKLGVTYVNISQYERNLRNPKVETLQKIADALEVPVAELMGLESVNKVSDTATLEKNLLQCGCSLGYDAEDAFLWINFPDGTLEVTEEELKALQNEVVAFLRFKLVELRKKHDKDFRGSPGKSGPVSPYFF